jgi:hypothetical protein
MGRGVRKNMSWLVLGKRIMKLEKLHHTIQNVVRGALKRGLKWQAYNIIEEDKYRHRQPYGQWLWIPKAGLIGHVSIAPPGSGGFIGRDKPYYHSVRWSRAHPLARDLKEVWRAYNWGTYERGKIRRYGGTLSSAPEFAHWLEAREVAKREGRSIASYDEWSKEMSGPFHSAWLRARRNPKGRHPRRNAGFPKMSYQPYGTKVVTTRPVRWHGLHIPMGTTGKIERMLEGGEAVHVKFDDPKYGSFSLFTYEVRVIKSPRSNPRRASGLSTPEMLAAIKQHSDKTGEAIDVSLLYRGYRNPFRLGDDGGGRFWLMSYQDSTSETVSRATMLKRYAKARWFIKEGQTVARNAPGRKRILSMKAVQRQLQGVRNLAISHVVQGWDTVLDKTERTLQRYGLAGMFSGELREIRGLRRRYKGHKMPLTTAMSPAQGALWKLHKALSGRRR